MAVYFERPVNIAQKQSRFSGREVGINHPDVSGYIKIADNGDIQIMADEGLGIIISPTKQTIFLVGKTVKIATNEIKWNQNLFNQYATVYTEPALKPPSDPNSSMYDDMSKLIGD